MNVENSECDHCLTACEIAAANKVESPSELNIDAEQGEASQKLWNSFQNAATSISQVYMDKGAGRDAFRNAAYHVTALYKDGIGSAHRLSEISGAIGYHRRTKEIISWAKCQKKLIRRDELIAMLAGILSPPPSSPSSPNHAHVQQNEIDDEAQLTIFRAAVTKHSNLQTLVTTELQRLKRSASSDVPMDTSPPKMTRFS